MNETPDKPFLSEEDAVKAADERYPCNTVEDYDENAAYQNGFNACAQKANPKIAEQAARIAKLEEEKNRYQYAANLLIDSDAETMLVNEVNALLIKLSQLEKDFTTLFFKLASITASMKAHPDCTHDSEFQDMVNISEKFLEQFKASRKI